MLDFVVNTVGKFLDFNDLLSLSKSSKETRNYLKGFPINLIKWKYIKWSDDLPEKLKHWTVKGISLHINKNVILWKTLDRLVITGETTLWENHNTLEYLNIPFCDKKLNLDNFINITHLYLNRAKENDFSFLQNMKKISHLSVDNTSISDYYLNLIPNPETLTYLSIINCHNVKGELSAFINLKNLYINKCKFTSFDFFHKTQNLTYIDISYSNCSLDIKKIVDSLQILKYNGEYVYWGII